MSFTGQRRRSGKRRRESERKAGSDIPAFSAFYYVSYGGGFTKKLFRFDNKQTDSDQMIHFRHLSHISSFHHSSIIERTSYEK